MEKETTVTGGKYHSEENQRRRRKKQEILWIAELLCRARYRGREMKLPEYVSCVVIDIVFVVVIVVNTTGAGTTT